MYEAWFDTRNQTLGEASRGNTLLAGPFNQSFDRADGQLSGS